MGLVSSIQEMFVDLLHCVGTMLRAEDMKVNKTNINSYDTMYFMVIYIYIICVKSDTHTNAYIHKQSPRMVLRQPTEYPI